MVNHFTGLTLGKHSRTNWDQNHAFVLEPELQEAQMEVAHLRHEVEKLKCCGIIYSPFLFTVHHNIDNLSIELTYSLTVLFC